MKRGIDVFRILIAVGALIVCMAICAPVFVIALLMQAAVVTWDWVKRPARWARLVRQVRRLKAPAWDAEGGAPELPWPPQESPRVKLLREKYAERRALPSWSAASRREFAEAKRKAVRSC